MSFTRFIDTQSPIAKYLAMAAVVIMFLAVVKFVTSEPVIETRIVKINGKAYHYQIREGEEQDTLTHMVNTYSNMFVANKMNQHCNYLTLRDTNELDANTVSFGDVVDDMTQSHEQFKQHIVEIRFKSLNARYECDAMGRATVEYYTHASRAIALGLNMVK